MYTRTRKQCSLCKRFYVVPQASSSAFTYTSSSFLCPLCAEPGKFTNRMIVIEAAEHGHLLRLYHATYHATATPSPAADRYKQKILVECNNFFSGGEECQ